MQIANIFSTAYSTPPGGSPARAVATPAASSAAETTDPHTGASRYDFTGMTSKELMTTVNNLVKSGKLSLKDSSPLVGIAQFANGSGLSASAAADGSDRPIDVLSALRAGIDYKQQTQADDPHSGVETWKNALAALQGLQGTPSGVDTYA
jgi:hypothetical protein